MNLVRRTLVAWRRLLGPPWLRVEVLLDDRRERGRLRRALRRAGRALDRLGPSLRLELIVQRSVVEGDRPIFGEWRVRPAAEGRLVVLRLATQVGHEVVPLDELVAVFADSVVELIELCGQQSEIRAPIRGLAVAGQTPLTSPAPIARAG